MAKQITLRLDDDPSKEEEKAFIEKLYKFFNNADRPKDTYLKSLFNISLMQWVQNQIGNDFVPDVYMVWDSHHKEMAKIESEKKGLAAEVKKGIEKYEVAEKAKEKAEKGWELCSREWQAELKKIKKDADTAIDKAKAERREYEDDNIMLEYETKKQQQEMLELKARLYDELIGNKEGVKAIEP